MFREILYILKKRIHPLFIYSIAILVSTVVIAVYQKPMTYMQINWGAIGSIATLLTAIFAAYSANMSKKAIEMETIPNVSIVQIRKMEPEAAGMPVLLFLRNNGKGAANILVVNLDRKDIRAHIGWPINVGSEGTSHLKIWLPDKHMTYEIKIALYYWDINGKCYCSEYHVHIQYEVWYLEEWTPNLNVDRDRTVEIICYKEIPAQPIQWDPEKKQDYFAHPWWDKQESCRITKNN